MNRRWCRGRKADSLSSRRPRYLLRSPFFVEDVGVLAGRPRHDCCPQSLMIRGVMSPGPEGAGDIADRGRAEVVGEAVRNVDAEL